MILSNKGETASGGGWFYSIPKGCNTFILVFARVSALFIVYQSAAV